MQNFCFSCLEDLVGMACAFKKGNLGKTGNLETELVLKVGAPVVITSNHSKQKYKDDNFSKIFGSSISQWTLLMKYLRKSEENLRKLYRKT